MQPTISTAIPASGCIDGIHYLIEQRSWFSGGQRLVEPVQFSVANPEVIAMHLTGPAFGDEPGIPNARGAQILSNQVCQEATMRRLKMIDGSLGPGKRMVSPPHKLGNWGEFRFVTF